MTPEAKIRKAERDRLYRQTPQFKARRARTNRTEATRAYRRAYMKTWRLGPVRRAYVESGRYKAKHRAYLALKKYGLTQVEFERMREAQNNACAICNRPFTKRPHVDHNHISGKIRGLLCGRCNTGIGFLDDNPEVLASAETYLRTH